MLQESFPTTISVVDVKIRNLGAIKKMGAGDLTLRVGDRVMLELDGEPTYGVVCTEPVRAPFIPPMRVMKSVLSKATEAELATIARHERIAREARAFCRERAQALRLTMKLVEVYCSFQRREITFVYTAEGRIDFRQLVRDLARRFGGRVEMRQVRAREEAKRLGGVDTCGLVLCCASFLTEFKPVNVRTARLSEAEANENRLIGVCGRLKCCLMFESSGTQGQSPASSALITPAPLS